MSSATAIAVGDTSIFLFGGEGSTLGRTYRYDVLSNTWTTLASMPTPVTDALVLKYRDSLVYVIGGGTGTFAAGYVNNVQVYNINTNTYSAATPYPITAGMMGGGLVGNTIISAGGWNGTAAVANAYRGEINPADPLTITWTPIPDYPIGAVTRMASTVVSKGGTAVVFAGGAIGGATITGESTCWNIANAIWEPLPVMPTPRSNMKGTNFGVTDSAMIVVAGFTTAGTGATNRIGFVSIDGAPNPLSPFNLVAPPNGATVLTSAGNTTPVTISWDTSATGARYNWIFAVDSTDSSPRLLTIPSNTNSLTLTLGQIDAALASLGLEPGQSQAGFWTVWAYKGTGAPGPDSLRANTWRSITFGRQAITLSPFNLVSPPDNTTLVTLPTNPNSVNITWTRSGTGAVTYKWFYTAPSLTGSVPTIVRSSNNGGLDTVLTLRVSQIDSILASAGVAVGDSVDGEWRVFAYRSATDSLASTQTFNLRLRRGLGFSYRVEVITQAGYDSLTTGTTVNLTGDDAFTNVPLPIPFEFAEVPQTSINICTNGFANFGTGSTAFTNNLSATTAPFNVIAPFWDDLFFHPTSSVTTDVLGTAPNRVFVIQYNDVGRYPSSSAWRLNFQIRLFETTNIIEFSYGGTTPGTETFTASIGLKGAVGGPGNFIDATTGSTTVANNSIAQFPSRGLKYRLIPGLPGFSNTKNLAERPKEFKLEQNYPNPFNPTTTIQFAVPSVSDVKLEVFNILGQKVASLVNRRMEAGVHTVNFNATNLSSGVYFYRLQAGNFVQTKKMMLVK